MNHRSTSRSRNGCTAALGALLILAGCGGNTTNTQPAPFVPATAMPTGVSATASPGVPAIPASSATSTPTQYSFTANGGPFTLVIGPTGGYSGSVTFPGVAGGSDCGSTTPTFTSIYGNQPPTGVPPYATTGTDLYVTVEAAGCGIALAPTIVGTLTAPSGGLKAYSTMYMIATPANASAYVAAPFTLTPTGSSAAGTTFTETGPSSVLSIPANTALTFVLHETSAS